MKTLQIKHIDAFTKTPFEGNPACVVNAAEGLTEKEMQLVAREMNLSETAFILPPTNLEADLQLRWFTPVMEVPLCGHATVAAFHSLAEDNLFGMDRPGNYNFKLETKSGILPIEVIKTEENIEVKVGLTIPQKFDRFSQYKLDIVRILNLGLSDLEPKLLILRTNYLFVPLRRLHVLYGLRPNYFSLTNFMNQKNLQGVCVFTEETIDRDSSVHIRFFAPNEGILEDPVTGSVHGALSLYLLENGIIRPKDGIIRYKAEQGDCIGRKGRLNVILEYDGQNVNSVYISGSAITIYSTKILVSDNV
jgi:trans-2,3-dihydro-3-hydroxyanthranilate isomerase